MQDSWTADQWKFIEWLATPRFTRTPPTIAMMAASIGVDDATLYRWQKLPGLREEVTGIARASLIAALPTVYGALVKEAEGGSYQHLQLLFEMSGEYIKQQKNINQTDLKGDVTFRFIEEEGVENAVE